MQNTIDRCSTPRGTIHRSGRVENGSSLLDTQAPAKAFQVGLRTAVMAITLAALGLAGPLPVRAQTTTITPTPAALSAMTGPSLALQGAIADFAKNPSPATAAAVTPFLNTYNGAVAANTTTVPTTPAGTASPLPLMLSGTAAVINGGSLSFSAGGTPRVVTVTTNPGGFFLGPAAVNLGTMGVIGPLSSPPVFTFSGNITTLRGSAIQNNGGTATITGSNFTGNRLDQLANGGGSDL
jgi:hypothetical protein